MDILINQALGDLQKLSGDDVAGLLHYTGSIGTDKKSFNRSLQKSYLARLSKAYTKVKSKELKHVRLR